MYTHDMLLTFKVIELLTKGAKLEQLPDEQTIKNTYFNKEGRLISRLSENVEDFCIIMTDDLKNYLDKSYSCIKRQGKQFFSCEPETVEEGITTLNNLSKEMFMSAVQEIYKHGICGYVGVPKREKDVEFVKNLEKLDREFTLDKVPEDFISEMTREKTDFYLKALLATVYYNQPQAMRDLYDFDKSEKNWDILQKKYPQCKIVDDRMFIPVKPSTKLNESDNEFLMDCDYIVISKNVYDYFFCSYGSAHQSCFSLNSSHKGFFGMIPMVMSDNHYIIYGTKSHSQKVSVGGTTNKYPAPYMFFRAWGWISDDDKLLVDKLYSSTANKDVENFLINNGIKIYNFEVYALKSNVYLDIWNRYNFKTYPDSARNNFTSFCRGDGTRMFIGDISCKLPNDANSVIGALQSYTVDENIDLHKDIGVYGDKLLNPSKCPITNIVISSSEDVHWLSSVVKKPVNSLVLIDWVDGAVRVTENSIKSTNVIGEHMSFYTRDNSLSCFDSEDNKFFFTGNFSSSKVPLQKIKTYIQNYKSEVAEFIDLILLRVVDKNQIAFIKYYTKKD